MNDSKLGAHRTLALNELADRWRQDAMLLSSYGAEQAAKACERHADELQAALQVAGDRPALRVTDVTEDGDRMLRIEEAAEKLGVEPRWLYERSKKLPFAKKLAPQTLRFSERGLYRWLATRS